MMNMAHCRFNNTFQALRECFDYFDDKLSPEENKARVKLLSLVRKIASNYPNPDAAEAQGVSPVNTGSIDKALTATIIANCEADPAKRLK
jgi:hypothetical protein